MNLVLYLLFFLRFLCCFPCFDSMRIGVVGLVLSFTFFFLSLFSLFSRCLCAVCAQVNEIKVHKYDRYSVCVVDCKNLSKHRISTIKMGHTKSTDDQNQQNPKSELKKEQSNNHETQNKYQNHF